MSVKAWFGHLSRAATCTVANRNGFRACYCRALVLDSNRARESRIEVLGQRTTRNKERASNCHIDLWLRRLRPIRSLWRSTNVGELRFNRSRHRAPRVLFLWLILLGLGLPFASSVVDVFGASLGQHPSRCASGRRVVAVGAHCDNAYSSCVSRFLTAYLDSAHSTGG